MKYLFSLLVVDTLSLWFETISSQELQNYHPMHSLTLTLQAPKEETHFKPFHASPQYQDFTQELYQPRYEVKEYNEEYPIQQFQSIKNKYRIQPLLPRNQFKSSTYSNYKSYQSKPENKKVALVKEYQNKKKMERVHAQLAQPQFQGLQHIKLSPIQLPEPPQIKFGNYHLHQQTLDIPEIQLPSEKVQQQLQPPTASYSPNAKFNEEYPVPIDKLQAPSMEPWNPNNNSNLYYKVPSDLTKMEPPINLYPKKYNPEVKPLLGKLKQQFGFLPTTTETMVKQEKEQKEKLKPNNSENEVQKTVQPKPVQHNKDSNEPIAEESTNGFSQGFNSDGENHSTTSLETEYVSAESNRDESESLKGSHPNNPAPKDRVEFQMHGFDGPLSYKWGFDTGEGRNRHFRYEERDKLGHVKGHYGYYDKRGKLRMVHYNANPTEGFNAETENFGKVNRE